MVGIGVVSPILAPASLANPCLYNEWVTVKKKLSLFECSGTRVPSLCYAEAAVSGYSFASLSGQESFSSTARGFQTLIIASYTVHVSWNCDHLSPAVYANVFLELRVEEAGGPFGILGLKWLVRQSTVALYNTCGPPPEDSCDDPTPSPIVALPNETLVISKDQPKAGAEWSVVEDDEGYDQTYIGDCFDAFVDEFSATFKIAARPSCAFYGCNCGTNLDGMLADFDDKMFTLGVEDSFVNTLPEYVEEWSQTAAGDGTYEFLYQQTLPSPAGALGTTKRVTIFCDTDDLADPPVQRWYALFETTCREWADGDQVSETTKTEIGYFLCGKSKGCNGRDPDEHIPVSALVDIEEQDGSPTTPSGLDPCTPPERAYIAIFEDCG